MRIHPRHEPVERAKTELLGFLLELRQKHSLTSAEFFLIMTDSLSSSSWRLVAQERREKT